MNDIQWLIDRQLGLSCRQDYDNVVRRLVVRDAESFHGFSPGAQEPPIFACRFAEVRGREHILALANENGLVAIQDTSKILGYGEESSLEGFQCHNNAVFDLAWMPGSMNFVTVSGDHTACLWDVGEGAPRRLLVFSAHSRSVKTAVFRAPQPAVFATGARDGHILVWDIRANNHPAVILKPDNQLMNCHSSFMPKTPGSHSKRPRIDSHRAISITGLVFQDDLTLISCGECDGNIKVWDLRKNYSIYTREPLPKHSIPYCGSSTKNGYTNLIVDDASVRLYASCMDNIIYCFNISTYSALPERRYAGHENGTFYIKTCLSPDGRYLVSGSSDKHAYIWNVRSSRPAVRLTGHFAEVTCAAWARTNDTTIVTCSDDARHKIWRVGGEWVDPLELCGRAELVPREDNAAHWGRPTTPPNNLKRHAIPTPSTAKQPRLDTSRKTKRCLTDLLNAARDPEYSVNKKPRLEATTLLPTGTKRPHGPDSSPEPVEKSCRLDSNFPDDWGYSPKAGSSFMTPTKNFERRNCRVLSPCSPNTPDKETTPKNTSPGSVVRAFTSALPDYVQDGTAPHMRLMSPLKRKLDTPDWLTAISLKCSRRIKLSDPPPSAPLSPKENIPVRRNSTTERAPKIKKTATLLKYFSVANKAKNVV